MWIRDSEHDMCRVCDTSCICSCFGPSGRKRTHRTVVPYPLGVSAGGYLSGFVLGAHLLDLTYYLSVNTHQD